MSNISYRVTRGILPVTVTLLGSSFPPNVHYAYEQGSFGPVDRGVYTLKMQDAIGCEFGIEVPVTLSISGETIDTASSEGLLRGKGNLLGESTDTATALGTMNQYSECLDCWEGFEPIEGVCVRYDTMDPNYITSNYTIVRKTGDGAYGSSGMVLFYSWNSNGTGVYQRVLSNYWTNYAPVSTTKGPMNRTCVWGSTTRDNQDIGFSVCVSIPSTKTYYVGFGCDNYGKIKVNGNLVLEQNITALYNMFLANGHPTGDGDANRIPFRYWFIYPIHLRGGDNIIEVYGHNVASVAGVGIQIYDNTESEIVNATSDGNLNMLLNSVDLVGQPLHYEYSSSGGYHGYYCQPGYALDTCGTPVKCVKKYILGCGDYPTISGITSDTATVIGVLSQSNKLRGNILSSNSNVLGAMQMIINIVVVSNGSSNVLGIIQGNSSRMYVTSNGNTSTNGVLSATNPYTACVEYGAIYNKYAFTDSRKITSSDDWIVPTSTNIADLRTYLGGVNVAGGKMKETGTTYWDSPNTGATNEVGFNARGAGYRGLNGIYQGLKQIDYIVGTGSPYPSYLSLGYSVETCGYGSTNLSYGYSIRLLYVGSGSPTSYTGNDGKVYRTIVINGNTWLADNLAETLFRNGQIIPWYGSNGINFQDPEWMNMTIPGVCAPANNVNNVSCNFAFPLGLIRGAVSCNSSTSGFLGTTNPEFISEWTVPTGNFTLPLQSGNTYAMTVDWGDGSPLSIVTAYNSPSATHAYTAGTYQIKIKNKCSKIYVNNGTTKTYLKKILQWGDVGFTSFQNSFYGCSNLSVLPTGPITGVASLTTNTTFGLIFSGCTSLTSIPSGIFDNCTEVASSAFSSAFYGCTGLTSIPTDLFKYNTKALGFAATFYGCTGLTSLPVDLFRYNTLITSTAFYQTFRGCTGLTSIPEDLFKYNTQITGSNSFNETFYGCTNLASIPAALFMYNTQVTGFTSVFYNCTSLTTIPTDLFRYNTAVTTFASTFYGCTGLTSIPATLFMYNTQVTTFASTFEGCTGITSIPVDIFKYNTLVTTFISTFLSCSSVTSLPTDLFRYNTQVAATGFDKTFMRCYGLQSLPVDLFRYNTLVSTNGFSQTFYNCTSLASIPNDLFMYNTAVSTNGFSNTFYGCSVLSAIPVDLFRYNVNVVSFHSVFYGCSSLTSIPTDLFRYNTAATTFTNAFTNCTSITSAPIDLFKYNTLATAFGSTFSGCIKLQLNRNIFYSDGEQSTRFAGKTMVFSNCFNRTTWTGTQGEAPDLWNCTFGGITSTTCFGGTGNNSTSISNYSSIPAGWK